MVQTTGGLTDFSEETLGKIRVAILVNMHMKLRPIHTINATKLPSFVMTGCANLVGDNLQES